MIDHQRLRDLSESALLHIDADDFAKVPAAKRGVADSALEDLCIEGIPGYDPRILGGACTFDAEAARRAIRFFPDVLRHVKGPTAGDPFVLEPWQQAVQQLFSCLSTTLF